jgi:hypothetical protein
MSQAQVQKLAFAGWRKAMAKTTQPLNTRRRIPSQVRAEQIVEPILAATAHILRSEGQAVSVRGRY